MDAGIRLIRISHLDRDRITELLAKAVGIAPRRLPAVAA
jgi:hypothetical protein